MLCCSMCCEKQSEDFYSTICGHIYHFRCMQQWQSRSSFCPKCQTYKPESHRIYLKSLEMDEYDPKKIEQLQQQLQKYHIEILQLKEDLKKSVNEVSCLRDTLEDTHRYSNKLEQQVNTLNETLNTIQQQEQQLNSICATNELKKLLEDNKEMQEELEQLKKENEELLNKQQQQQQQQQQKIEKSIWFIRQTSSGNYQINGPFKAFSQGIIAAKKESLHETGLTIKGLELYHVDSWFQYVQSLANRMNYTLEERDIIKMHKSGEKLFIQFRTAEWRERFMNYQRQCYCKGGGISGGISFTTEIVNVYDTFFEYVKTLKDVGYKAVYRHGSSFLAKRDNSCRPVPVDSVQKVDALVEAELKM